MRLQWHVAEFIGTLNQELSQRVAHRPRDSNNSLMPVVQINAIARHAATLPEAPKRGGDNKRRVR